MPEYDWVYHKNTEREEGSVARLLKYELHGWQIALLVPAIILALCGAVHLIDSVVYSNRNVDKDTKEERVMNLEKKDALDLKSRESKNSLDAQLHSK